MSTPVAVSDEFDLIQRYLIPSDSISVRYCMDAAWQMSRREDPLTKRLFPIPFVVAGVALSFFNAISYFLQIPFITLFNFARMAPVRLLTDPFVQIINTARSVLFIGLGLPLTISGLIFPEAVFSRFAPDAIYADEQRFVIENQALRERVEELEKKLYKNKLLIEAQAALIQKGTQPSSSYFSRFQFWKKA